MAGAIATARGIAPGNRAFGTCRKLTLASMMASLTTGHNSAPDVVGIGALNLDYIIPRSTLPLGLLRRLDDRLKENLEVFVPDQEMESYLREVGTRNIPSVTLGGSTFNTIRTILELKLELRVGYVGVIGLPEGILFQHYLEDPHVDREYLFARDAPSSKCFAEIDELTKQRRLLTSEGATRYLRECITLKSLVTNDDPHAMSKEFVLYLTRARWIHVTSLRDYSALEFIANHIAEARSSNPGLRVSFDPGHQYAKEGRLEVIKMINLSDFLFVSWLEMQLLAGFKVPSRKHLVAGVASRLFESISPKTQVVVLKQTNATSAL